MYYLSQLLERKVVDASGRAVGKLHDISMVPEERSLLSRHLVVSRFRRGRRELYAVPWEWVGSLEPAITLNREREDVYRCPPEPEGLLVQRSLLDRQIVDIQGRKVERVNDVRLSEFDSRLRLTGVDVSPRALLRRLGLEKPAALAARLVGRELPEKTIPWEFVAPLDLPTRDLQLRIAQSQLKELHPSDMADILEQVEPQYRERLLDLLSSMSAAESLSEVDPDKQVDVIGDLSETKASNILGVMPPDEAADILRLLPRDKAERLLSIMGMKESRIIRELLGYGEDTAGGRMTPEFLGVPGYFTAAQCIEYLRRRASEAETLYYLYVLDDEGRLKGVLSLRDLLTHPPDQRVEDFMNRDVISVHVDDDQEMVADLMRKYNFLALPVVDDDNVLKGIVTVDDMMDVLKEETVEDISHLGGMMVGDSFREVLRGSLPGLASALVAGMACTLLLSAFRPSWPAIIACAYFLPWVIRVGEGMGMFSQAAFLEATGGRELERGILIPVARREMTAALILSLGTGALSGPAALWLTGKGSLAVALALSLVISSLVGMGTGTLFTILSHREGGALRFVQTRLSFLFMTVITVPVYVFLSKVLLSARG